MDHVALDKNGALSSLELLFQKLNRIQNHIPFAIIHFKARWYDGGEDRDPFHLVAPQRFWRMVSSVEILEG